MILSTVPRHECSSGGVGHVRGVHLNVNAVVSEQNIHPFWFPGTALAMAHNGDLYRFAEMKEALAKHIRPELLGQIGGSTDSEWIYALLLSQLADPCAEVDKDEVLDAIVATYEIIDEVRQDCDIAISSAVNLFLSDGSQAFAVRFCFDFGCYRTDSPEQVNPANLNYLSLWYTSGREYGHHDGEWKMVGGSAAANSVMIASEPLTADVSTWLEVPEHSILYARSDGVDSILELYQMDI